MRVTFILYAAREPILPVPENTPSIKLGNADVSWVVNKVGNLKEVRLSFAKQRVKTDGQGRVKRDYPRLVDKAYRIATYLSNAIYKQTGKDVIDPDDVLQGHYLFPETEGEKSVVTEPEHFCRILKATAKLTDCDHLEPAEYANDFQKSTTIGYWADAKRARSVFVRYEHFFKIVEYYFEANRKKGIVPRSNKNPKKETERDRMDMAIAKYAKKFDNVFGKREINYLHELRNRSTHPKAKKGHVNPHDRASVQEVKKSLPLLEKLCRLLLEHPPS